MQDTLAHKKDVTPNEEATLRRLLRLEEKLHDSTMRHQEQVDYWWKLASQTQQDTQEFRQVL
jgi:hypothetical protein